MKRLHLALVGLVSATRLAAQASAPAHFAAGDATVYADSFVTIVQGQERGWHTFSMSRADSGFLYREAFSISGMMGRNLTIAFDRALEVRTVTATGTLMGQAIGAELSTKGRHVTGWAITDIQTTPRRVVVDTILPVGGFDGSALMALLPTLRWEQGKIYSLTMFDSDEMSITTQTLRIVGTEEITVPAGTFAAFRAELSSTQAPVRLWYTRDAPHRLLKVGDPTDAFATVLVRHR